MAGAAVDGGGVPREAVRGVRVSCREGVPQTHAPQSEPLEVL